MAQKTYAQLKQRVQELEAAELDKKAAEAELRKSETRLKVLSDASFEAIFLSAKGICIDQNKTAEKLFGYTLQEARGRHGSEWITPEDRELVRHNMLLDYAAPYEVLALRKDGTVFPCEIQARNMAYNGRIIRVTALRDITERKQAEREKEHLRAKLANAIEMAHLGPWEYDVIKDIFIFNDSFYKMFRTTAGQVGGYTMPSAEYARRFVHPDEIAIVADEIRKAKETADPQYRRQLEHRFLYADGTVGYTTVRIFIQKDTRGQTVRTYGVNQDITRQKQSEVALRKLNEQLEERSELAEIRAKQLQNLAMELIESEERERRRISELLHDDLQQVLSAALLQLDAGRENLNHPAELAFAHQLLNEAIRKTRDLSYDLSPAALHHSGLVAGLRWLVRQIKEKFDLIVQLDVDLPQELDYSPAKVFIYRAVQELLFNTVKHSGVKQAHVTLVNSEQSIQVSVSDHGRGFDTGRLEAFSAKAGLGLMSLRERAHYFGGSLEIESWPGWGSRFTLTLPIG